MGRTWTEEEKKKLSDLYLIDRLFAPEIAKILGRGVGAVRMKITTMGLSGCGA